jgi:hypothetical protein
MFYKSSRRFVVGFGCALASRGDTRLIDTTHACIRFNERNNKIYKKS